MAHGWHTSNRKSRLPANWPTLRKRQLELDGYRCVWQTAEGRCKNFATDVDHVEAKKDDHSRLQSLCADHHKAKTSREGHLAYTAQRRQQQKRIEREFSIKEKHPGAGRRQRHLQPWERS